MLYYALRLCVSNNKKSYIFPFVRLVWQAPYASFFYIFSLLFFIEYLSVVLFLYLSEVVHNLLIINACTKSCMGEHTLTDWICSFISILLKLKSN